MTVSELQTVLHEIIAEYFPNTLISIDIKNNF